jgi:voltage-gated potassium channel
MTKFKDWRNQMHEIIFEADTPSGKLFDVILLISIGISVIVVMLDTIPYISDNYGDLMLIVEWTFTVLFTVEYVLRLLSVKQPLKYAGSFFGWVDLLAILPSYISLFIPGSQYLLVIRILRVLRIFRVLKVVQYVREANMLMRALRSSWRKIAVFLFAVMSMVVIFGSLMYLIEGGENGFTSIPRSIYWAIVTLTTVGYGDITPQTAFGQMVASMIMIIGYGVIAVPTGIVTAELTHLSHRQITTKACTHCGREGHDTDSGFCKYCGEEL